VTTQYHKDQSLDLAATTPLDGAGHRLLGVLTPLVFNEYQIYRTLSYGVLGI